MKIKHGFLFALAGLAFSAVVPTADAAVYVPGLAQAKFTGSSTDKTSDIASAANLTYTAGPIMANTTGSAKDWDNTSWSWADNRVFGYIGQMWMEAGTTYTFGKSVDDWTYIVVDGTTLIDDNGWNSFKSGSYTATETGWVPIEVRVGNGGGGAGVSQGAKWGVAYNMVGDTSWDHFKAGSDGWSELVDPGDCSLLRVAYSNADMMTIDGVAIDGNDLVVTASFTGLAAAGTLTAFYGAGDGETTPGDWDANAVAATPAAGDTASAQYRVADAGSAAFVAFRLSAAAGTSTPIQQWSDSYALALASPAFKLVSTDVGYTNLSFAASCIGLGQGASSVDIDVELATDAAFADVIQTKRLALTSLGSESVTFVGLTTNTTYYARVVGTNDKHETGASSTVSKTTLDPQPPEGVVSFAGRGFTKLSAAAIVSDFGDGSDSAEIRLEASTDANFSNIVSVSTEVGSTLDVMTTLSCENLSPDTAYHLRLRIVNEWGIVSYVPISEAPATRTVPITASGIGYVFAADNSTIDFSFGITEVFDGKTCTATLSYGGRTFVAQTFSAPATLSWPGLTAVGPATAMVTVSSTVGGTTYTQTWTVTVTPGTSSYTLSSLLDLRTKIFHVGDSAMLPELTGPSDYYALTDCRAFKLGTDGVTLTALEPGFGGVVAMEYDAASDAFVCNATMGLGIIVPEPNGSGRVWIANKHASGSWYWANADNWTNVTDGQEGFPNGVDDVAMIAQPGNSTVYVDASITLGALYFGFDSEDVLPGRATNNSDANTAIRLTGSNASTLTFQASGKNRPLMRFCNFGNRNVYDNNPQIYLGYWNATAANQLNIVQSGDMDWDGGAVEDYTDTATRNVFGRVRFGTENGCWAVPAGATLHIYNVTGYKSWNDDQCGNAQFWLHSYFPFIGSGEIVYDGPGSAYVANPFRRFEGTITVRNKQKYDTFCMGSRGGSFYMINWESPVDQYATNATLKIEGDVGYNNGLSLGQSYGAVSTGSAHGYGSPGWMGNVVPAKKWILNGGAYYDANVNNNSDSWREDGTKATETVLEPNGAETLCVSNGFSWIYLGQNNEADRPTNNLQFACLEHVGDGVLIAQTDRMFYSYQSSEANRAWRVRLVLGGFHDYAIGGTGAADAIHGPAGVRSNVLEPNAPIVPWIVAPVESALSLYFPGASPKGELVMAGHPGLIKLDEATDQTANVNADTSKSLALSADLTVNSLRVPNPNSGGGINLGEGRKLTITSGGLIVGNGSHSRGGIGTESGYLAGTAGTVYFPNKAYVFTPSQNGADGKHSEIWAKIVSPRGAVFSYPGYLDLGGDQTGIDERITLNGTYLKLGSATTGCSIDVPVHLHGAYSTLAIQKQGSFCRQCLYFWDHATPGSKFIPAEGTEEVVYKLYIDGVTMPRGTYGATGSGAEFIDDKHFSGTGTVRVLRDDLANPLVIRMK